MRPVQLFIQTVQKKRINAKPNQIEIIFIHGSSYLDLTTIEKYLKSGHYLLNETWYTIS